MLNDKNIYEIKVLLVDDQPIVASAVKMMLVGCTDISFHYCNSADAALEKARLIEPTVILQDLVMPDADGLDLVKQYRADTKLRDIPLIVLSSKEEAETKANSFALGANDYLVKLPDKVELIARIRYHSKSYINSLQKDELYNALLKSQEALSIELKRASEYVVSLIPHAINEKGIRTEWKYVPSADLGGDSFGYHFIDDFHFAMYLLDVCDHGVGPALLSVSALNVLRSQTLPNTDFRDPKAVLAGLNNSFLMEKQNNLYFTIWYGVYDLRTRELEYSSAGHPPALLVDLEGNSEDLITKNLIPGHLAGYSFKSGSVIIKPHSELFILSDGAYEIKIDKEKMWSYEEMKQFIINEKNDELEKLYQYALNISGESVLDDDFSMMKISFD